MGTSTGFCASLTVALAVTVAVVATAAAAAVDPTTVADDVVYDQRQNGTENVRISLSDLKVVLAPADGLFQIMSMAGAQFLNSELANSASSGHRPTGAECTGFKCNRHRQAAKKNRFKLSSLIAPLLNQAELQKAAAETENNNNHNNNNDGDDDDETNKNDH